VSSNPESQSESPNILPTKAPFDGILTARDINIAAYVAAGSGARLFRVVRISPLRVYINVPMFIRSNSAAYTLFPVR
jgi:hypothetical protein